MEIRVHEWQPQWQYCFPTPCINFKTNETSIMIRVRARHVIFRDRLAHEAIYIIQPWHSDGVTWMEINRGLVNRTGAGLGCHCIRFKVSPRGSNVRCIQDDWRRWGKMLAFFFFKMKIRSGRWWSLKGIELHFTVCWMLLQPYYIFTWGITWGEVANIAV